MRFSLAACLCLWGFQVEAGELLSWQGFDRYLEILGEQNVQLGKFSEASLIFVLGEPPKKPSGRRFRRKVQNGATLVIATEYPGPNGLLKQFGLSLGNRFVMITGLWGLLSAKGGEACFMGQPDCPLITDFPSSQQSGLLAGVRELATNRAKEVRGEGDPLGFYPAFLGRKRAFGRTVQLGKGRVVALGDQSLFINLMIAESSNERFLQNILGRHQGQTVSVFISGRQISPEGPGSLPASIAKDMKSGLPIPDLAPNINDLNRLLSDLQATLPVDRLNRQAAPLLLAGTMLLVLWLLTRGILNTFVLRKKPFGRKGKFRSDHSLVAARLTRLSSRTERKPLLRLSRNCRSNRRYNRFIEKLTGTLKDRS